MGLDMYLSARRYTSDYSDKEARQKLLSLADSLLPPDGNLGSITISRDVAYWRKANQIHKWFVDTVQEGNDDCGTYDVSREQLEELLDRCRKVVAASTMKKVKITNGYTYTSGGKKVPIKEDGEVIVDPTVAKELLPPAEGFFFGSDDLDQWYIENLKDTITQLEKVLAWCDAEQALTGKPYCNIDFQYHSSW